MAEIQARLQPPIFFRQVEDGGRRCQSDLGYPLTTKLVRAKLVLIRILMLC